MKEADYLSMQLTLFDECECLLGGAHPRFFVWENVPGAFSSNKGLDFRAVLEEIGQTEIPMPKDNKWADAGLVECDNCQIAWRVLDAQFWGVPQRRRRIFLVADFGTGRRRAREILFVIPRMPGDIEPGGQARERVASTIEKSIRTANEIVQRGGTAVVKIRSGRDDGTAGKGALIGLEQSFTLGCGNDQTLFQEQIKSTVGGQNETIYDITQRRDVLRTYHGICPTLNAMMGMGGNNVPVRMETIPKPGAVYDVNSTNVSELSVMKTLDTSCKGCYGKQNGNVVCFSFDSLSSNSMKSQNPISGCRETDVAKTLDTTNGDPSKNQGGIAVVYPLEGNGIRESHRGPGYSESDKMFTLNTVERHGVAYCIQGNMVDRETKQRGLGVYTDIACTLTATDRHAVGYDAYQHHNWRESETIGPLTTHGNGVRGDTPLVADISTTGGQNAYAIGNGQTAQLKMQEVVGTLNCMHDQIAVMQEIATEPESLDHCAPTTMCSTDKTSHKES